MNVKLPAQGFHSTEAPHAWQELTSCTFVATSDASGSTAAALPGFACVRVPAPSQASVSETVTKALQLAFEGCSDEVADAIIPLARATAAVYDQLPQVLPVRGPSTEHYAWSLQDVFCLIQVRNGVPALTVSYQVCSWFIADIGTLAFTKGQRA